MLRMLLMRNLRLREVTDLDKVTQHCVAGPGFILFPSIPSPWFPILFGTS